jgi:PAS domain S-box-containing protein
MKKVNKTKQQLLHEVEDLRMRLNEAEEKLRAIRGGEDVPGLTKISEHKRVEKSISWLGTFPEMYPNPIVEVDLTGTVHYLNPIAKELFPDLPTTGIQHPWLVGLKALAEMFEQERKSSSIRELKINNSWFEQVIYYIAEGKRLWICGIDITQRKQTEEALKESEERYRRLFEDDLTGDFIATSEGKIIDCNPSFVKIFGFSSKEEALNTNFFSLYPELKERETLIELLKKKKKLEYYESVRRRKDGTLIHIVKNVVGFFNDQGMLVQFKGYLFDNTKQKQVEERLKESERKYRELYEGSQDGFVIVDMEGRIKEFNHAFMEMIGYSEEELLRLTYIDLTPQKWHSMEAKIVKEQVLSKGYSTVYEKEYIKKNGTIFPISLRTYLTKDTNGNPSGVWAFVRDISKRKEMEQALLKSRDELEIRVQERSAELIKTTELLERVFSSIDILIAYMDKNFNFLRVNRVYAEADQRDPEFYVGKNHFVLFPNEENEAIFRKVLETGEPYFVYEKPFVYAEHPGRGVTYWDWSLQPVKEPDGSTGSVVLSLINVTERKMAEEAVRENEALLRTMLETLPVGVWITDKYGRIVQGNPAGYKIWAGAKYVGIDQYGEYKGWWLDTGKQIEPEEWAAARAITKGETSISEAIEIECFDGTHKIILNSAIPIKNDQQEVLGAFIVNQDITELKRQEKAIKEQSRILEAFFASTITPLVFLDRNFNFIRVNEAYAKCCQRDISEFKGHNHFEFYPHEENEAIFRRVVETKAPYQAIAKPFTFPDHPEWGTTYWDWTLTPLLDDKGDVEFLVFSLNDVTERKRAEEALRTASLYTRSLIEASLDPLVTISADGKVTDVNRATELVTGFSRDQLIGSDFSDYFTEPDKAREGYQKVFSEGSVRDYPLAIRHTSGHTTDVLYNATLYRNEAGEVQGVFAAARDITEQKLADQERLRLVGAIEQSSESILITDDEGVIRYVNPAFEHINGSMRQEVLGKNYYDILKGSVRDEGFEKKIEDTLSSGQTWKGHITRRKEDGTSYELDVSISPVRDPSGTILNHSVVERDVTHEVILEQHLRQRQKMEALGTLAGGIAHDFNNILMPIMINTELALYDTTEGSPTGQYLKTALEASKRGQELVKQIITLSRQKEQEQKPVKITPIIKEALKFLRATLSQDIEIRENVDVESGMILADPTQVHQVLMNLCSNAAHAMREKGGVLEVNLTNVEVDSHMSAKHLDLKPGPYLKLTVSDTGHGMDQEIMKRIFDPFFTTKKLGEGSGMGLAVVHGIVKRHEGSIIPYSEVGKGSTFNIFFPRVQGNLESETMELGAIPRGKEQILLVDDEVVQVRSEQHLLERLGYKVIAKTDSLEALEVFRSQPEAFDLVITDQAMPHMTGIKLAEELMHIRSDIPIILCTGFSEAVDGKEAKAMGIREFMMKPFSARHLAETIRRVLEEKWVAGKAT